MNERLAEQSFHKKLWVRILPLKEINDFRGWTEKHYGCYERYKTHPRDSHMGRYYVRWYGFDDDGALWCRLGYDQNNSIELDWRASWVEVSPHLTLEKAFKRE